MNIINVLLVVSILVIFILPFIVIPIVLFINSRLKRKQDWVNIDPSDDTVRKYIKVLKITPLLKYDKKFETFGETFNTVNKNKNISKELKKELYDLYIKKGCDSSFLSSNKR